ncbi:hypothetical protein [Herminiimonas sp. CN]|uniref:hypothetical protein n=1 Tax=Herminiimonas sp. CN TaxID=1349818 RepID=UPI00047307AC|nr:hypothetical protein [Herminiimonas sp. CN]
MRLSPFFHELKSAYDAELEDMRSDSAGNDVLTSRLHAKRAQIPELMPMINSYPEMGAVAFHTGIQFVSGKVMDALVTKEPDEFPAWATLLPALELTGWAGKLAETVLAHPDGEQFLIVSAGLEYLHCKSDVGIPHHAGSDDEDEEAKDNHFGDDYGDEEDAGSDLAEAGSDWMVEQGFDRNN